MANVDGVPLTANAPPEPRLAWPDRRLIPAVSPVSGCAESASALTRITALRTPLPPVIVSTGVVPPRPAHDTPEPWHVML